MAMVYENSEMFVKHEKAKADAVEQTAKKIEEANKKQKESSQSLAELDEELRIKGLKGGDC